MTNALVPFSPQNLSAFPAPANIELAAGDSSPTMWTPAEGTDITPVISGAYLGAIVDSMGWNAGHVDEVKAPVPEAGFTVIAEQASYGFTGVSARALVGFTVEALTVNKDTQQTNWVKPSAVDKNVRVNGNWGRMQEVDPKLWGETNLGNPGTQTGIVKVTDIAGKAKYYALGANFEGEPDGWIVRGAVTEVYPRLPSAVESQKPQLPSA